MTALNRLADPAALARIARTHPDWVMRKAAVGRLTDTRVLSVIASEDRDVDVRRAALREQAGPLDVESQGADPRKLLVRRMLADPALVKLLGRLELDFRVGVDEKRYVKEDVASVEPAAKGKVLVESVAVTIRKGDQVLFRKSYRGQRSRKAEAFDPEAPVQGGYLIRVNSAEVDYVEIAQALLADRDARDLKVAMGSNDKYILAAAAALSDSWRGGGAPKIESRVAEASDDD
jgi:hypothetical protein